MVYNQSWIKNKKAVSMRRKNLLRHSSIIKMEKNLENIKYCTSASTTNNEVIATPWASDPVRTNSQADIQRREATPRLQPCGCVCGNPSPRMTTYRVPSVVITPAPDPRSPVQLGPHPPWKLFVIRCPHLPQHDETEVSRAEPKLAPNCADQSINQLELVYTFIIKI